MLFETVSLCCPLFFLILALPGGKIYWVATYSFNILTGFEVVLTIGSFKCWQFNCWKIALLGFVSNSLPVNALLHRALICCRKVYYSAVSFLAFNWHLIFSTLLMCSFQDQCSINITYSTASLLYLIIFSVEALETIRKMISSEWYYYWWYIIKFQNV